MAMLIALRHQGPYWGLKFTPDGYAMVEGLYQVLKQRQPLDPRDTILTCRYVLYWQGEAQTKRAKSERFNGFTDQNGVDWVAVINGLSGVLTNIVQHNGMKRLRGSDIPVKVYHNTKPELVGAILVPPSRRTASCPGGLLPGGAGGVKQR